MGTLRSDVDAYFASVSSISKKILSDQGNLISSYGDEWDEFSQDQQEELFDKFIVRPDLAEKYKKQEDDEVEEVFPKLKINCGEKIVIDFDNDDGWTWRDEHSGPFSWASRSQQDLTLLDLDETAESSKEDRPKKPVRPPRRHRSPDPNGENGKGIWSSPFLSGQNGGQEMSAADEIFLKFGIQFGADKDEEETASGPVSPVHTTEESKLLGSPAKSLDQDSPLPSPVHMGLDRESSIELTEARSGTIPTVASSDSLNSGSVSPKRRSFGTDSTRDVETRTSFTKKAEADESFMEDLYVNPAMQTMEQSPGHVSPVYLEEPGESSTDPVDSSAAAAADLSFSSTASRPQPPVPDNFDDFKLDSVLTPPADSSADKTGFAFLDNW